MGGGQVPDFPEGSRGVSNIQKNISDGGKSKKLNFSNTLAKKTAFLMRFL